MNSRKRNAADNNQQPSDDGGGNILFPLAASANDANTQFSSIPRAVASLCMSARGADIRFIPMENADTPPKKFPAHKALLSLFSPVFSAMFHYDGNQQMGGGLKKIADDGIQEVELEGVEPVGFEQFIKFVYTEKADLSAENVASVLYTANRYASPALAVLCEDFIRQNLSAENVLAMLDLGVRCGYTRIHEAAMSKLMGGSEPNFFAEAFRAFQTVPLGVDTLCMILGDHRVENIFADETALFNTISEWAKTLQAGQQQSVRELLGPALFQFRFFRCTLPNFISTIAPCGDVLSADEKLAIINRLHNPEYVLPEGFPFPLENARPRPPVQPTLGDDVDNQQMSSKYIRFKVVDTDTERIGLAVDEIRFLFDGRSVLDGDTPASMEMEEDDVIEAYQSNPSIMEMGDGDVIMLEPYHLKI